MPHIESDATAIGTAVHAAIEMCCESDGLSLEAMMDLAKQLFDELMSADNARWIQTKTYQTAYSKIYNCLEAWYNEIWLPGLETLHLEYKWGPLLLHEDDERQIFMEGTVDHINGYGLRDWKTSAREYREWEKKRWDIQSTVYTWAWATINNRLDEAIPFEFVVMDKNGSFGIQRFSVERGPADWAWLKERCIGLAKLIEADLSEWPKNDNTALCSAKWCPVYAQGRCKGSHFVELSNK